MSSLCQASKLHGTCMPTRLRSKRPHPIHLKRQARLPSKFHSVWQMPSGMHRCALAHHICAAGSAVSTTASAEEEQRITDQMIRVKLSLAHSTGRLDLADMRLSEIPPEVFEIADLEDLALSGNCLTSLPQEIGNLRNLKRLGLAGNMLSKLPTSIGNLTQLQGLWLHGNLLQNLPEEFGSLTSLERVSLAGNRLNHLPDSFGNLQCLVDLTIAGNQLTTVPDSFNNLSALNKLTLNGNRLTAIPEQLSGMTSLKELLLMGNNLQELGDGICGLKSLKVLCAGDNQLQQLPAGFSRLTALTELSLYGNKLRQLPKTLSGLSSLQNIWLEGNPLESATVTEILHVAAGMPTVKSLGLDINQMAVADKLSPEAWQAVRPKLRVGKVLQGPGYFKITPSPLIRGTYEMDPTTPLPCQPVLVVAFGSATCVPNWGGLLERMYKAAKEDAHKQYDVLYVVDATRDWYHGGEPQLLQYYRDQLQKCTSQYKHVVMVGESMGATAALMFSPLATAVMGFSPQVDLEQASIRPGKDRAWQVALKQALIQAVEQSSAEITLFTGTWKHDLDQCNMLPVDKVKVQVYSVDSHRLALYLDMQQKLLPLVQATVLKQLGLKSGNVRLHNLV